jgi:hypothetical protein
MLKIAAGDNNQSPEQKQRDFDWTFLSAVLARCPKSHPSHGCQNMDQENANKINFSG